MARENNVETNAGMVANPLEMLNFVSYLKTLVNELTAKLNIATQNVNNMESAGYCDETFRKFQELFVKEAKFINHINTMLENSGKHYQNQARIVDDHNKHIISSKYGSDLNL